MEIKVQKESLAESLAWMQSVVERKTTMPILSNILIEAKGRLLSLTATDLEVGIIEILPAEVITPGKVALPARGLYDIVRELPNQLIAMKEGENHWMEITCARSNFKLVGMDPKEFPALPQKEEGASFSLEPAVLMEMIEKVDMAISTDETRYNLNGIYIETEAKNGKNLLKLVATDGHRLSISERDLNKKVPLEQGVIFPRKGVMELKKMLEAGEGEITAWLGKKHVLLEREQRSLLVRLIDGQFPPYRQVLPKNNKRIVSIPKDELTACLRRAMVMTSQRLSGVQFTFSPGHLEIKAQNPDLGESREELSAKYKGATFSVGFNAAYFLECLAVMKDQEIVLQLNDEVSPCLIQSEHDSGFAHVIMPMRL